MFITVKAHESHHLEKEANSMKANLYRACLLLLLGASVSSVVWAQAPEPNSPAPLSTLDEAIRIATGNNRDIRISTLETKASIPDHHSLLVGRHIQVNKVMPDLTVEIPNWLLQMENILEELNEEAAVFDSQLPIVFANEVLLQLALYERGEMRGRTTIRLTEQRIWQA
jgi:PAS domain-containing protein